MNTNEFLCLDDADLISTAQKMYGQGHTPRANQGIFGKMVQEIRDRGYQVYFLGTGYGHMSVQCN
jgi:hypothetical protein